MTNNISETFISNDLIQRVAIKHGLKLKRRWGLDSGLPDNVYSFAREIYNLSQIEQMDSWNFEQYAISCKYDIDKLDGEYISPVTKTAWNAWKSKRNY